MSIAGGELDDNWLEVKLASIKGGRFGLALCTAPDWLLESAKLKKKKIKTDDGDALEEKEHGAVLVFGGINMENIYGDTILIVPPKKQK